MVKIEKELLKLKELLLLSKSEENVVKPYYKAIKTAVHITEKQVKKKPIKSNKHLWKKDDNGKIDRFGFAQGYCNGPECELCGDYFCEHCNPNYNETKCYIGHYTCSVCKTVIDKDSNFCKECGQAIDWSQINSGGFR